MGRKLLNVNVIYSLVAINWKNLKTKTLYFTIIHEKNDLRENNKQMNQYRKTEKIDKHRWKGNKRFQFPFIGMGRNSLDYAKMLYSLEQ